jgi:hypothetical protein
MTPLSPRRSNRQIATRGEVVGQNGRLSSGLNVTAVPSSLQLTRSRICVVAEPPPEPHALVTYVGLITSVVLDTQGQACGTRDGWSSLNHLEIAGDAVGAKIMSGLETDLCRVIIDPAGRINLVYASQRAYLRATLDRGQ